MKHSRNGAALIGAALLIALLGFSPILSHAQDVGGPPPQGGMGMMPSRNGFGMAGMMNRKLTAASAPVADWASALKLSAAQQSQIAAIQAQSRPTRPGGGSRGGFNAGGPPPQGGMGGGQGQGGGGAMDQRDAAASAKIDALLSASQRTQLTDALQQMDDLRATGLQPSLFAKLNLTGEQKAKLSDLATQSRAEMKSLMANAGNGSGDSGSGNMRLAMAGVRSARAKTREAAYAILNSTQLALAKSTASDNGPGGMGGPGMGGPPPMQGGPGGGGSGGSFNPQSAQSFAGNEGSQDSGTSADNGGDDGGDAPPPPGQ